jgi:hypothetical protein
MDPKFRDRAPRLFKDTDGKERLVIEEQVLGSPDRTRRSRRGGGAAGLRRVEYDGIQGRQGRRLRPACPHAGHGRRRIDAAFLFPTLGLFSGAIHDPELAAATCRAYNRWLADYCGAYPDRLFGIAMLPLQSVDLAVAEMGFARKELGFKAGFIRPNPYHSSKMVSDPRPSRLTARRCRLQRRYPGGARQTRSHRCSSHRR